MKRLIFLILPTSASAFGAAYPACQGYANVIPFTYNPTGAAIGGSLTGFPQMFYITDTKLKTAANGGLIANASAFDTCVSSVDDVTSWPFQIEKYDGTAGTLWFYFRPTTTLTTSVTYHLWVGKVTATNPSTTAVWTGNYSRVMLLPEPGTPNGAGAGVYKDSTSNAANSTGGTNPTQVTGLLGNAQSFSAASNQWIAVKATVGSGSQTIQVLANPAVQAASNIIWDGRPIGCGGSAAWMNIAATTGFLQCKNGTNIAVGTTDVRGAPHVLGCQYTGSTSTLPFVDGVAQGTGAAGGPPAAESVNAELGKSCDATGFYNGTFQNFESSQALSADWLKLEAYQTLNTATVVTLGTATAKPIITSFACSPATVTMLTSTTCTGAAVNGTTNLIAGGGDSSASTSGTFTPDYNTFYSYTVCNTAGCSQATFSVVVNAIAATGANPVLSAVACTPYSDSVQCSANSDTVSQFTALCGTNANGGGTATPTGNTWTTGTLWPLSSTADGAASAGNWGRVHLKNSAVVIGGANASHGLPLFCVVQATNAFGGPTNSTQQPVTTLAATVTTPFRFNNTGQIPYTRLNSQYNGSEGMPNNGYWDNGDTRYNVKADDGLIYGKSTDSTGIKGLVLNNSTVAVYNYYDGTVLTSSQPLGINAGMADSSFTADSLDMTYRDGCMYMVILARTILGTGQIKSCDHWITSLWSNTNVGPNTTPVAGLDMTKHTAAVTASSGDGTTMSFTMTGGWGGFPPPVNRLLGIAGGNCNGRWITASSDATHVTFLSAVTTTCVGATVVWFPFMWDVNYNLPGIQCPATGCPPVQGMDAYQYYLSPHDRWPAAWVRVRRENLPLQTHASYQCFSGTPGTNADWLDDTKWSTLPFAGPISIFAVPGAPCTSPTGGPFGVIGWYKQHIDFIPSFNRFQLSAYWDQDTGPNGGMGNGTPFWDIGDTPVGAIPAVPVGHIRPDPFRNPGLTPGFPNCITGTFVQDSASPLTGHQTCTASGGPNLGPGTGGDKANYALSTYQIPYVDASIPKVARSLISFSGGGRTHIANGLQYFANLKDSAFGLGLKDQTGNFPTTLPSGSPIMAQYGLFLGSQNAASNVTDGITWTGTNNYLVTTGLTSNIGAAFSAAVCFGHAPYTASVFGQSNVTVNPIVSAEVVANYTNTFSIVRHLATSTWDVAVRGTTIGAITITEGSFGCVMIVSAGTGAKRSDGVPL